MKAYMEPMSYCLIKVGGEDSALLLNSCATAVHLINGRDNQAFTCGHKNWRKIQFPLQDHS